MVQVKVPCDREFDVVGTENIESLIMKLEFSVSHMHNPENMRDKLINLGTIDIGNITGSTGDILAVSLTNVNIHIMKPFDIHFGKTSETHSGYKDMCSKRQKNASIFVVVPPDSRPINYIHCKGDAVPVLSLLQCPLVQVRFEEYKWRINADKIYFMRDKMLFDQTQFFLRSENDSYVMLCKEQFTLISDKNSQQRRSPTAEVIVSIVCSSLSIFSLTITVVIHLLLKSLQNLPGKNNLALTTSFLLAQILYLVGSLSGLRQGSIACRAIGLLTHFFWLLVIFWMNVCTFHMFRVMTRTAALCHESGNKKYLKYHLYCFMSAVVLVSVNIIVSTYITETSHFGYGDRICYISSAQMALYTFGLPLAIIVACNICLFLVVIVAIKRISNVQRNVINERNLLAIFTKLSTLTGMTWAFGFLYAWTENVVFSYLFIVLNAGQGFFLFVALICNQCVLHQLKLKILKSPKPPLIQSFVTCTSSSL